MRLRNIAFGCLLLAGGCLVPRYDFDPPGASGGSGGAATGGAATGGAATGGAAIGAGNGSVSGGSAGSSASSAGNSGDGSAGEQGCTELQKDCGGECVALDDPAYGCSATSCDSGTCPVPGEGTLACEGGACVVGSCAAGSKKCDGKCVALDDPTYGCSDDGCDGTTCPDAAGGTVVCNQGTCEIGSCTANTKACDGKCVPKDRNNGCNDPTSCEACTDTESCGTENAACECYATNPCVVLHCGEATDRCGKKWQCDKQDCSQQGYLCHENYCVQCVTDDDCSELANECLEPYCTGNNQCSYRIPTVSTPCFGGGTCSAVYQGVCDHAPVSIGSGNDIDPYEVTAYQYFGFLDDMSGAVVPGLPAACSYKTNHYTTGYPSLDDGHVPVTRVDWCDAYAYCQHVGRRLCGKIGGGPNPYLDWNKPASSQWMKACQGPNVRTFPYGNTAQASYCHDDTGPAAPVGSFAMCEGGYSGVFDMSGNVMEWEDSCSGTGMNNECALRGGGFTDPAPPPCAVSSNSIRTNNTADNIGFRCCSQ